MTENCSGFTKTDFTRLV